MDRKSPRRTSRHPDVLERTRKWVESNEYAERLVRSEDFQSFLEQIENQWQVGMALLAQKHLDRDDTQYWRGAVEMLRGIVLACQGTIRDLEIAREFLREEDGVLGEPPEREVFNPHRKAMGP